MGNTIRFIAVAVVAFCLTACGEDPELTDARTTTNNLRTENSKLRADLNAEIKAKKVHAIAEEKFKNLHKQAVTDHATALNKLRACQSGPQPKPKKK